MCVVWSAHNPETVCSECPWGFLPVWSLGQDTFPQKRSQALCGLEVAQGPLWFPVGETEAQGRQPGWLFSALLEDSGLSWALKTHAGLGVSNFAAASTPPHALGLAHTTSMARSPHFTGAFGNLPKATELSGGRGQGGTCVLSLTSPPPLPCVRSPAVLAAWPWPRRPAAHGQHPDLPYPVPCPFLRPHPIYPWLYPFSWG